MCALDAVNSQLRQTPGQRGILAAGNTQDIPLRAGVTKVIGEECDAALNLLGWIDQGLSAQGFYDAALEIGGFV